MPEAHASIARADGGMTKPRTARQKRAIRGQNCEMPRKGLGCGNPSVTMIAGYRICQFHRELLNQIKRDAHRERLPQARYKDAAARG